MSEHSAPVIPIAASPHFAVAAMVRQHTPRGRPLRPAAHHRPHPRPARPGPARQRAGLCPGLRDRQPGKHQQEWADAEIDRVTEELALDLEDDLIDLEEGEDDEEAGTEGGRDR